MEKWATLENAMTITLDDNDYHLSFHVEVELMEDIAEDEEGNPIHLYEMTLVVPIPNRYPDTPFRNYLRTTHKRDWAWLELTWEGHSVHLNSFYVHAANKDAPILTSERSTGLGKMMLCYALHLFQHPPYPLVFPVMSNTRITLDAGGGECSESQMETMKDYTVKQCLTVLKEYPSEFSISIRDLLSNALSSIGYSITEKPDIYDLMERLDLPLLETILEDYGYMSWNEFVYFMQTNPSEASIILIKWDKDYPDSDIRSTLQREYCVIKDNEKLVTYYERYGFQAIQPIENPILVPMEATVGEVTKHCNPIYVEGKKHKFRSYRIKNRKRKCSLCKK